jgi:hypothetical protein
LKTPILMIRCSELPIIKRVADLVLILLHDARFSDRLTRPLETQILARWVQCSVPTLFACIRHENPSLLVRMHVGKDAMFCTPSVIGGFLASFSEELGKIVLVPDDPRRCAQRTPLQVT